MYKYKSIDRRAFARNLGVKSVVSPMGVDGSPNISLIVPVYLDVEDTKANLTFKIRPTSHQRQDTRECARHLIGLEAENGADMSAQRECCLRGFRPMG
jgi:hypothetical protein